MTTPKPLDRADADAFWQRYQSSTARETATSYLAFERFGDSVEMADELLALIVDGPKRATAGSVAAYVADGDPLPQEGDEWIAADGAGVPRVVLRTVEVRIGPLSSVDDAFAWDEGEGDRTRDDWIRSHRAFFERYHDAAGLPYDDDLELVFERFDVVYVERD